MLQPGENILQILDSVSPGIIVLNYSWQITYANVKAQQILNVVSEPDFWSHFPAFTETILYTQCTKAVQDKVSISVEGCPFPNGISYHTGIYPSSGGIMIIMHESMNHSQFKEPIKHTSTGNSEHRFRTLAGNAPVAIFETNIDGETIYVNEKMIEYIGLPFDKLLGTHWIESIHPDDRMQLEEQWKDNFSKKEESASEYRIIDSQGDIQWLSGKAIPVYDNGMHTGYLGSVFNVTSEKLALLALKDSEEKYRMLVEQASDGIYIADMHGHLVTVNSSACRLSGYSEKELLQMTIYDFVSDDDLQKQPFRFQELSEGKTVVIQRNFSVKDGVIIKVECTANMLSDGRILVFARDISDRLKAHELLEKSYEDIRNLASHLTQVRDEERKRIGREIHDELGQQLTAMKMDVAWLDKKIPDTTSPLKKCLKNIEQLLDESNGSVRRILMELSPGVVDNGGLIAALERQNRQFMMTTGTAIEFTVTPSKLNLKQEIANCIFRVYQESLTNIVRYAAATKVATSLKVSNDTIELIIEDNGKGFDVEERSGKKSFGIIGMSERVLSQNGTFSLQSQKGKGTKISIKVPYSQ